MPPHCKIFRRSCAPRGAQGLRPRTRPSGAFLGAATLTVLTLCAAPTGPMVGSASARIAIPAANRGSAHQSADVPRTPARPHTPTTPHHPAGRSSAAGPQRSAAASSTRGGAGPQPCQAAKDVSSLANTAEKIARAYQLTALYRAGRTGAGVTVGVIEPGPYDQSDLDGFADCYGIPHPVVSTTVVGTGPPSTSGPLHTDLVIETILSIAPGAHIHLYLVRQQQGQSSLGALDDTLAVAVADRVPIISMSFAVCEANAHEFNAQFADRMEALLEQAGEQGQTLLASSGNNGSHCTADQTASDGFGVSLPASDPWVTGVGGTALSVDGSASSERVWKNGWGASGGGISTEFPMPTWQRPLGDIEDSSGGPCRSALVNLPHHPTPLCREVPDVSANADLVTGYPVYVNGTWEKHGGTSAATPLWAGVVALMDQGCGNDPAGFLNPKLYAAATDSGYPNGPDAAFHDITIGDNDPAPSWAGWRYKARVGYDLASGLGTPDGWNLTRYLSCKPAVSSVSPSSGPTTGGTRVTITGSGFAWAPSAMEIRFGAAGVATKVSVVSPTELQVTTPPSADPQLVDVTVTTPAATSTTTPHDHYTYTGLIEVGSPGFRTTNEPGTVWPASFPSDSQGTWQRYSEATPTWYTDTAAPPGRGCGLSLPPNTAFEQLSAQPTGLMLTTAGLGMASYNGNGSATWTATAGAGTWKVSVYEPPAQCLHYHQTGCLIFAPSTPDYPNAATYRVNGGRPQHAGWAGGWTPLATVHLSHTGAITVRYDANLVVNEIDCDEQWALVGPVALTPA